MATGDSPDLASGGLKGSPVDSTMVVVGLLAINRFRVRVESNDTAVLQSFGNVTENGFASPES